jgi:pantoate--beta-alanine ligase
MGALHDGHLSLIDAARAEVGAGTVLVTVFVNPAQFGPNEDFEQYPRNLDDDVARCAQAGVDAVFAPSVDEVYPDDETITDYQPGPLGETLEGAIRPGHFAGVLKVVSRLLQLTKADVTCFGEKDYQQLTLVRRLPALEPALADCRFVGVPIKRDLDGLAMSSRNRYLTDAERSAALALPETIELVRKLCEDGVPPADAARFGKGFLATSPGVSADYVLVLGTDMGPAPQSGVGRVILAARVGSTRLLDNGPVTLTARTA